MCLCVWMYAMCVVTIHMYLHKNHITFSIRVIPDISHILYSHYWRTKRTLSLLTLSLSPHIVHLLETEYNNINLFSKRIEANQIWFGFDIWVVLDLDYWSFLQEFNQFVQRIRQVLRLIEESDKPRRRITSTEITSQYWKQQ